MSEEQIFQRVVLKDFNQPAPNGLMYDLDHKDSQLAIKAFCEKKVIFGEHGQPGFIPSMSQEERIKRGMTIDLSRVIVHIKDPFFTSTDKKLYAYVKFANNSPISMQDLLENKVCFGMRSVSEFRNNDPEKKGLILKNIVTFDIINPGG